MTDIFQRLTSTLAQPLIVRSRVVVFVAFLALIPTFFVPLWHMSFYAQQYPEGLELYVYSHDLVGGDDGNDLTEINILNHYIGMAELDPVRFTELKWIPLIVGLIGILTLRAVAIGTLGSLIDVIVMAAYFAGFSLWSFWSKLHMYGHNLDPKAAVKVDPFTPPVFGYNMVGQFEVWSYPALGSYLFTLFAALLMLGVFLSRPAKSSGKKTAKTQA